MFFAASKIFWLVAEPVSLATFAGMLGIALLFTRFVRAGRILVAGGFIALAIGLLTPAGALILRPLEDRFLHPPASLPEPAGIIVLGGAINTEVSLARGEIVLNAEAGRMTAGAALARRYPRARLVFSGGSGDFPFEGPAEAVSARELWLSLGVPAEQMVFEEKSRNTWENALYTRDLVKPKLGETWLLVTSAWHMPRSIGIFRRLGFPVVPYPASYHTFGDGRDFRLSGPMVDRLSMLEIGVREWIGLAAYRLAGKTDALFPAP